MSVTTPDSDPILPSNVVVDATRQAQARSAEGSNSGAFAALDWGLLAGAALIWSASFAFISVGLRSYTPAQVAFGRILFGMCALSLIPGSRNRVDRSDWPRVALVGITWMAIPLSLFPIAEQWIDSSAAGMLNAGMPLCTVALSWAFLRRGPYRNELIGVLIGLLGVLMVIGPTASGSGKNQVLGVLCCLVAVFCYGLAAHLNVPLVQRYGSAAVLLRALFVAALVTAGPAAWGWRSASPRIGPTLAIIVLGAFGTGVAYAMGSLLLSRVGAIRGSIITYVMPPLSVLWGVMFFDDRISAMAIVGTVVILFGAWTTGRSQNPTPTPQPTPSAGPAVQNRGHTGR